MIQAKSEQQANTETSGSTWTGLYKVGGVAPLAALALSLIQIGVMIAGNLSGEPFPTNLESWFLLLQRNKILGLFYLNALDIFTIAFLGVMFLALYIALRATNPSAMLIAAYFAFLGIAAFVIPRVAMLSTLTLSNQYAAATSEILKSQLLAAGEALGALGTATPQTMGFFFIAIATLIISTVILRSELFSKWAAYVGILTSVLTFTLDICVFIAPTVSGILLAIVSVLWMIWWILVARGLLRLGRDYSENQA